LEASAGQPRQPEEFWQPESITRNMLFRFSVCDNGRTGSSPESLVPAANSLERGVPAIQAHFLQLSIILAFGTTTKNRPDLADQLIKRQGALCA
jgi:hypothetical protein